MTNPTKEEVAELRKRLIEQAETCRREGWPEPLFTKAATVLEALQSRCERLEEALRAARGYVNDSLELHEHSDGRGLLNRIDGLLTQAASVTEAAVFQGLGDLPVPVPSVEEIARAICGYDLPSSDSCSLACRNAGECIGLPGPDALLQAEAVRALLMGRAMPPKAYRVPLIGDDEIEKIFAEVDAESGELPTMDATQIAYAVRAIRKAVFRERIRHARVELHPALAKHKAAVPVDEEEHLLTWLAGQRHLELSYDRWDEEAVWQVNRVHGGRNDQEWTLVATGETPADALRAALSILREKGNG